MCDSAQPQVRAWDGTLRDSTSRTLRPRLFVPAGEVFVLTEEKRENNMDRSQEHHNPTWSQTLDTVYCGKD